MIPVRYRLFACSINFCILVLVSQEKKSKKQLKKEAKEALKTAKKEEKKTSQVSY